MYSLVILAAVAATGIDVGWEPLPDGGYQYTIQIEPDLAATFAHGDHEIVSSVPAHLDVRRYRLIVGNKQLARVTAPGAASTAARPALPPADEPSPAVAPTPAAPPPKVAAPRARRQPVETAPPPKVAQTQSPVLKDLPPPPTDPADHLEPQPAEPLHVEPDHVAQPAQEPEVHAPAAHEPEPAHLADAPPPSEPPAKSITAHEPAPASSADTPPHLLLNAGYSEKPKSTEVNRPTTNPTAGEHTAEEPTQPWPAFFVALVLLCCSLGANAYLGWIAYEARSRYRDALSKLGSTGAA